MPQANISDRSSLERIYPREMFERDAGRNSVANTPVLRGVTIRSEPDPSGNFELATAKRQTGERDPEGDTVFVPPFLNSGAEMARVGGNAYGGEEQDGARGRAERASEEYGAFIDGLLDLARSVKFKSAIGRKEERLKGFHGG